MSLEIKNLSKQYGNNLALNKLNLTIKPNSIHGLIGSNGAGKSTTMNILSGIMAPTMGIVKIVDLTLWDKDHDNDYEKNILSPKKQREVGELIGHLPESLPFYPDMKVVDFLIFMGRIHSEKLLRTSVKKLTSKVQALLASWNIEYLMKKYIGHLSKGEKQKVGLAMLLIYSPKFLLLDEPTSGLDPISLNSFRELLLKLKEEHLILLSSHQLHEISSVCDTVTILDRGRTLYSGSLMELKEIYHDDHLESIYLKVLKKGTITNENK